MNKEMLKKAIRAELFYDELLDVCKFIQSDAYETKGDFYAPHSFIDVCKKKLDGKIKNDYFSVWVTIVCNLLNDEHYDLSDYFDGLAFNDTYSKIECREMIAVIKDYDIKLHNPDYINYHKRQKMKVVYYRFEFVDHSNNDLIYKCYIVDHENKTYDVRIVDTAKIGYDLSKNYCNIIDEEHQKDLIQQEQTAGCIDGTKPQKQFCEAEETLLSLFCKEEYKRDKKLKF